MPTPRLLWIAPWVLWSCTDKAPPPGPAADPDVPPTASITAPLEGGPWYSDHPVALAGTVADAEDAPDALDVRWATAEGGDLGVEGAVSVDGAVTAQATLPEGDWTLLLEVTDSAGNTASDGVPISVGGPNQPPDCALTAPEDGTTIEVGAEVRFAGTATDADVGGDRLSVTWQSDLEGELQTSVPDADGVVGFTTSDLAAGTHRISLLVADEVGATCARTVDLTVGTPPTLTLDTPADGERVNAGAVVTFTGSVADAEDAPEALSVSWESSLDGVFSGVGADATGALSLSVDDLQPGAHDLTVTVTDSDGLSAVVARTLTVNAVPTAPTVTLAPDPATTLDDLVATATGATDPDGSGAVTLAYAWTEDGAPLAETTATLSSGWTTKGRTYRVTVTPSDDLGAGASAFAERVVANSAPVLDGPTLSAATAQVGDTLTCAATAADDDPADRPTVTYAWQDGSTGATYTVAADDDPGDPLTCTATADDGDGGRDTGTASATVRNTAPVLTSVTVTPATAQVGDTLTCAATATDADGGSPVISMTWPDGSTASTYVVAATDDPGDTLTCSVIATDTDGGRVSGSASATVRNTAPELGAVTITPASANNDDTLTCSASATDADGGTPTVTYAWSGSLAGSLGSGGSLDLSTTAAASAEVITCAATAADLDGGSDTASTTRTLDNRAPSVSVTLTPSPATRGDTLTCAAAASDADGDAVTTSFAWTVAGASTPATTTGAASSTLSGAFTKGQAVVCWATATDGKGGSVAVFASETIANTPPPAPGVAIAPSAPEEGEDLVCEVSSASVDVDGDAVTYAMTWTRGGVAYAGATSGIWPGDTIAGAATAEGDLWACTATPNDGTDGGSTGTDSVTVLARQPVSLTGADADYVFTGTNAYDYAGHAVAFVGDVEGDGVDDFLIGAHGGDTGTTGSGTTYLFLGGNLGTGSALSAGDADVQITGENPYDAAGLSVSGAGDVDGDGLADLLIGTRENDDNGNRAGKAYLVLGGSLSGISSLDLGAADAGYLGESASDEAGRSVAAAGDVNDDGFADLLIGAPYDDDGGGNAGKAYLLLGSASAGGGTSAVLSAADYRFIGEDLNDVAGFSVAGAGDVDGDGFADLLVGAYGAHTSDEGKAYLVLGGSLSGGGAVDLSTADHAFLGAASSDAAGTSVSGAGDVDGDGLDDVLVGAPYNDDGADNAGNAHLFLAASLGASGSTDVDDADATLAGEEEDQWVGRSVGRAGDLDGDGLADILVGGPYDNDALGTGSAYVFFGDSLDATGTFAISSADYTFAGENAGDAAGFSLAGEGDADGDGTPDILVGAWQNNDGGLVAGRAYLFLLGN